MRLRLALTGLVILALVGLVTGTPLVAGAAAFVAGLWALGYRYGQEAERTLVVDQVSSAVRVALGTPLTLTLAVTNPLRWPIPILEWENDLPDSFDILGETSHSASSRARRVRLFGRLAVGQQERVLRRIQVRPTRRGRFVLGPVVLHVRDPLGIVEWHIERETPTVVTVYPRLYPVPAELWRPALARGERRGPPWNPPDPSRLLGVRPYEPGDPPRLIHPYATARTGKLQVKRLETEAQDVVELVVLAATAAHVWHGIEVDRLEAVVAAAASASSLYISEGAAVGLSLAGSVYGSPRGLRLSARRGAPQRDRLLTALAWAQPGGGDASDLALVLLGLAGRVSPGTPVLIFTTFYDTSWTPAALRLMAAGARLAWVAVAYRGRRPTLPNVPVYAWTPGALRGRAT